MKYEFKYETSAFDFWQFSMYNTYGSMVGVCNLIFTVAMFLLAIRFWAQVNGMIRILLIIACSLFLVIQPLVVYISAKKRADKLPKDMRIAFDDQGLHVKAHAECLDIKWQAVKKIINRPSMLILFSTKGQGFILSNKVLGTQKQMLYQDAISKLPK